MIRFYTMILLFLLVFINLTSAQNKNIDNLIKKYSTMEGFTSVHVKDPAKTLPAANKQNAKELKDVLDGVDVLKIIACDPSKAKNPAVVSQFNNELTNLNPGEGFKEAISVKEKNGYVKMFIKQTSDKVTDLLMIASEGSQITMIWFNGTLDLTKLTNAAKVLPNLLK